MSRIARDLSRSPIVRIAMFVAVVVGFSLAVWPTALIDDVGDAFAISAGVLIVIRFGVYALSSLRKSEPDNADTLIVSVWVLALSIAGIRVLRWIGLELGIIMSQAVHIIFGALTALMVFGMFLLVASPPMRYGKLRLSARCATLIAIGAGALLAGLVLLGHARIWVGYIRSAFMG